MLLNKLSEWSSAPNGKLLFVSFPAAKKAELELVILLWYYNDTFNAIWQKIVCPWKSAELTFFVRRWTYLIGDGNSNFPIEREERHVCVQQLYKTPLTLQWDNNYLFLDSNQVWKQSSDNQNNIYIIGLVAKLNF